MFLGRDIARKDGWREFAKILVRQLVDIGCLSGWDILVEARAASENDELTETNEYVALGQGLSSINIDAERHLVTLSVPDQEIEHMNLLWDEECHAEGVADTIVQYLWRLRACLKTKTRAWSGSLA